MRFGVLGPLTVRDGEGDPVAVPEVKVRALLAALLVHEGRPVSADRLIDGLWGDDLPGNPANALQAKVSQLRKALGRDRVVRQAPGYRLRLDETGDEVDADRFLSLVDRAGSAAGPRERAELLTEALELWRGPAYADFADEEFVRTAAQRLTEQRLAVREERAEALLESGDLTLLTGELADLVARHPLRERLRAVQLRALYRSGRQSEALASYAELRARLADELGLDPSPELAALHEAILRQDPALAPTPASPAGAAPPPERPRSNLPAPLTALVGRERSLAGIGQLLATERLVTLTGPGGVGKTRLAVEAARRIQDAPDGVWLVELAGERGSVADLAQVVSAALGLRDDALSGPPGQGAASAPEQRLATALRDRRTLLLLDNCEQVVDSVARLTESLLSRAPHLRILATTQEPLCVTGETVHLVEPLEPADAVRLFTARAAAASPGFSTDEATPEIRAAVLEICRRLDGIPLALELAATRVRALGVRELADRLEDRFRVLTSGRRGAPPRQQTLRAVIDWSWELLSVSERTVLRRLAVHRDGCTLDAAEEVCAGGGVRRDEVLDLVTRLVDRSLVVVVTGPGGAGPRYRLLESVAAYAEERLRETDELAAVRHRHLRHYAELAERAEPRLRGGGQREWLGRLDAETANLRAALDEATRRASTSGATGDAVRLATDLSWWWLLRGRLSEARRALSAVLSVAPSAGELRVLSDAFGLMTGEQPPAATCPDVAIADPVRRGRAVWFSAYGLFRSGDLAASEEAVSRALALFDAVDDRWGTAAALGLRSMHALIRGDLDALGRDGLRSATLFRELGDRWGELQTVEPLAALAEIKGEYAESARRHEEGLRMARELGLDAEVSARLSGLGRLALLDRDGDRAAELHEQARRSASEQGYKYGELHAEMGLALGARRSGDLDAAQAHLLRIRDAFGEVSSEAGDHLLQAELGFVAELRGDAAGAAAHHLLGLDVACAIGEPRAVALSLEGLAGAAALAGDGGRAAALLGSADAARRSAGAPLPPAERGDVDRITARATAALGGPAFAEAFGHGADLSPAEAARTARLHFRAAASGEGPGGLHPPPRTSR
ncbi:BTAD domain-containing putative transcriptional regulator [Streptomyces sp. NBC_00063]|uniref:BTAD domain-containing putative transcriptional regulator n=1 Tax=Streptomyces sp. NBC_00063 TaxID=2975638 RepID=UPI002258CB6C|nr:BTAD domain-containing putative transcriptional regulator [Streptomyces sp. NBC_00063]MCX5435727.1 NB-ARC domain-containing protein [Streptomyces sp. NBC_00063]